MQSSPFLDLLKEARHTAHSELIPPMRAALHQVQLQNRSENATLIKIPATTPTDTLPLLRGWQVNPDGVPPTICQEEDGSMNLLNIDIWLWMQTIAPSIAPVVFKWVLWKIFQEKGQWATLTKGITPPSPVGDTLRLSIKCQFDWGGHSPQDVGNEELADWVAVNAGITIE